MTCYTRHLSDLLPDAPTAEDRRVLDDAIRRELALPDDALCPEVWAAVKGMDREELTTRLRRRL